MKTVIFPNITVPTDATNEHLIQDNDDQTNDEDVHREIIIRLHLLVYMKKKQDASKA